MQTMAKKYGALVVIGELRYYGESKPFGNQSYVGKNGQYADMGNIIYDFVSMIQHIKKQYGAEKSPVITTGGSYGGQIAAFMRFKFPEIVQAAVNSGGPILYQRKSPASPEEFYNLYLPSIYDKLGDLPDGKKCGNYLIEAIDRMRVLHEIPDKKNRDNVMKEVSGIFGDIMCQKYAGTEEDYPGELVNRLNGEIWEAPSRV